MYSVASTSADLSTFFSNIGTTLGVTIAAVLVGMAALIGLGFAVRHITRKVTGKKF